MFLPIYDGVPLRYLRAPVVTRALLGGFQKQLQSGGVEGLDLADAKAAGAGSGACSRLEPGARRTWF